MKLILTAKNTQDRLSQKKKANIDTTQAYDATAIVKAAQECQTMLGFGGAFTEAAAVTLSKLSRDLRQNVIQKYYGKEQGLGYNLGRVHMNSCDFSLEQYTYVEPSDNSLGSFDICRDKKHIIPLIKDAVAQRGEPLKTLASSWSPPAWMKSNNSMDGGGKLLPQFYASWALYYTKFIQAYEKEGVDIWGITVQNEPEAIQTWESCIYTAEEERDFLKNHLGPALYKAGYGKKKILIWDHNRDVIVRRVKTILDDPDAAKYVWGTAFHGYISEEFENVGKVHDMFPDKHLLFTEGCEEGGPKVGEWFTGERYGRHIIGDVNKWCEGFIDWNIVLDETGGPNRVGNFCDAPVIADTKNNILHYNSSYYYIGHFSKFVQAGARRLVSNCEIIGVHMAAFKNPDGKVVIVVMNEGDQKQALSIQIKNTFINVELLEHSIVTLVE